MSVRDRAHSLPGGNFQYPHIAGIITGLMEDQTIDPPFLPYDCRHNKHTGARPTHHTPRKHSMRGRACSYPPVEKAPEIDQIHSVKVPLFGGLPCGLGYGNMHSEVWS